MDKPWTRLYLVLNGLWLGNIEVADAILDDTFVFSSFLSMCPRDTGMREGFMLFKQQMR